jgi:hypothetical protein
MGNSVVWVGAAVGRALFKWIAIDVFQLILIHQQAEITRPQQTASAAIAVANTLVPYGFARACSFMARHPLQSELKSLNEKLEIHIKLLADLANAAAASTEKPEAKCADLTS